ncbi:hypothetical protein AGR7A_pTi0064 [Agrobacterium deltaense NCPPB 1641]|uniref:Uncharacterized protein n=1 Tax=Agrobacterium deltaense NCPPB 1641 TaxID=1183425 RepID=A0A1S7UD88_9HYPH|nr:hypothetical protein AGR7A_pTi0064 [Agrobacterium deltaense NCPPB 1641]
MTIESGLRFAIISMSSDLIIILHRNPRITFSRMDLGLDCDKQGGLLVGFDDDGHFLASANRVDCLMSGSLFIVCLQERSMGNKKKWHPSCNRIVRLRN